MANSKQAMFRWVEDQVERYGGELMDLRTEDARGPLALISQGTAYRKGQKVLLTATENRDGEREITFTEAAKDNPFAGL